MVYRAGANLAHGIHQNDGLVDCGITNAAGPPSQVTTKSCQDTHYGKTSELLNIVGDLFDKLTKAASTQ